MIKTIKQVKISFLIILILTLIISCPNKLPIENNNKIEETRDENGHLEQINYYDNDTLYKTEFYEYLNKHDEESRLIKTVENEEITYEMEECWKVAYCLQNNTYKFSGALGYIFSNRREKFGEININDKTIEFIDGLNRIFSYDIESGILTGEYTFSIVYNFTDGSYEEIGSSEDGNKIIMILAED